MTDHDELLDARGMMCPEPLRLAALRMRKMAPDSVLLILATDPAAPIDFEAWCHTRGHLLLACESRNGCWRIRVRRVGN